MITASVAMKSPLSTFVKTRLKSRQLKPKRVRCFLCVSYHHSLTPEMLRVYIPPLQLPLSHQAQRDNLEVVFMWHTTHNVTYYRCSCAFYGLHTYILVHVAVDLLTNPVGGALHGRRTPQEKIRQFHRPYIS